MTQQDEQRDDLSAECHHCYSQDQVDAYGRVMGARSKIHFDPDWATPRYGGTIVPGLMLMASAYQLTGMLGANGERGASVELKFVRPVFTGKPFTATAVPDDVPGRYRFELRSPPGETVCVVGSIKLSKEVTI